MIVPQLLIYDGIKADNISAESKMNAKKSENIYPSIDALKRNDKGDEEINPRKRRFPVSYYAENDCESLWNSTSNDTDNPEAEINEKHKYQRKYNDSPWKKNPNIIYIMVMGLIVAAIFYAGSIVLYKSNGEFNVFTAVEKLKQKYSKQNKVLWQNVMKIVNDSEDSVHSFVLLYKNNGAVAAECFAKDLIAIINKIHNNPEVVIYKYKSNVVDYGEELNNYLKIVKNSKHMIVPKLHEMSGEIAKMFHTLCDIGHYSIRPSYFIFTLEDTNDSIDPSLQIKKPFERVGNILRKAWSNLADNELHPLISRIVRNVAELSDVKVSC